MDREDDFYRLLRIEKHASAGEIKQAYREQARQYHPDVNTDEGAEEQFKRINEAYAVLSDSDKRRYYDLHGTVPRAGSPAAEAGFQGHWPGMEFGRCMGKGFGCGFSRGMGRKRSAPGAGADPGSVIREGSSYVCKITLTPEEQRRGTVRSLLLQDESGRRVIRVRIPPGKQPGDRMIAAKSKTDETSKIYIEIQA